MLNNSEIIPSIKKIFDLTTENNDSFMEVLSGDLSNSLFFLYKAKVLDDDFAYQKGIEIVQSAVELANTNIYNCKFAYGFPGLAWLLTFLKNEKILDEDFPKETKDYLEDIFLKSIIQNGKIKFYDLFYGMIGKGIYFLEQEELSTSTKEALSLIIGLLDNTKIEMGENKIAWLDYYTSQHDPTPRAEKEYFNIGLSHGIPSIIIFLCRCIHKGIRVNICKDLIRKACNWLLSLKSNIYTPLLYPSKVFTGSDIFPINDNKKLAWCYGDLGVSLAFANVAYILEDSFFYNEALEIAINASKVRKIDLSSFVNFSKSVDDLCFCHGSAGVAHIFEKLGVFFKDLSLTEASHYWLKETLNSLNTFDLGSSRGILEGLPGVGIVLLDQLNLTNVTKTSFNWNKPFLTDIGYYD